MKPLVLTPRLCAGDLERVEAALRSGIPVALLPPRLPPAEAARLLASVPPELPDEVGALLFTSGSTGRRKGVLLDRAALAASAALLGSRDGDRWLVCLSLATIGGLSIVTRSLRAGLATPLVADGGDRFDPAAVIRQIERDHITLVSLVPTMLARMLDLDWQPPAHLRAVLLGGAAADAALLARGRRIPIRATYGMTETSSHVAIDGRVLPGVEVAIRGGRIAVRGPVLFRGYLPPHDLLPARDPDGWFVTADRGEIDPGGRLIVLGRADGAIVSGGANVDPAAVEAALTAVPGIDAACAFGLPDPEFGQRVAAAVVVRDRLPPGLEAALRVRLATHELPRRIAILGEIPTGPGGKIDRAETARRAAGRLRPL